MNLYYCLWNGYWNNQIMMLNCTIALLATEGSPAVFEFSLMSFAYFTFTNGTAGSADTTTRKQ
jgi:hypothetical protein